MAALYRDPESTPNAARLQAYADTMARLYRDYPKDTEVAIFYALALDATAPKTDTTFAQQKRAAAILNPLFARYPSIPVWPTTSSTPPTRPQLAHLGLSAARRYAQIAPAAPHAQHMPSHIFVRLGYWDETIASNLEVVSGGRRQRQGQGMPAGGRGAPRPRLRRLRLSPAGPGLGRAGGGRDGAEPAFRGQGPGGRSTTAPRWPRGFRWRPATGRRRPPSLWRRSQGLGIPAMLSSLHPGHRGGPERTTRGGSGRGRRRSTRSRPDGGEAGALLVAGRGDQAGRRSSLGTFAEGDTTGGLALAKAAADTEEVTDKHPVTPAELLPARELEGDMLLDAGRYPKRGAAYRATLAREPGRARSLFGAARAAELAGNRTAAQAALPGVPGRMSKSDGERPELTTARKFLRS